LQIFPNPSLLLSKNAARKEEAISEKKEEKKRGPTGPLQAI
jgi:hypothetical protein